MITDLCGYNWFFYSHGRVIAKMASNNSSELSQEILDCIKNNDVDGIKHSVKVTDADNVKAVVVEAGKRGAQDIVLHFIEADAYALEDRDNLGNSLLHLACHSGNITLVKTIMEKMRASSIDIFLPNQNEETAIHSVCVSGNLELMVFMIEEANFKHDLYNKDGLNILHSSCKYGRLAIVEYLISKVHMNPIQGTTDSDGVLIQPIHFGAMYGHKNIVTYLIEEYKCDPHAEDQRGRSVLYLAADGGNLELMEYLVEECQCNPNHTTKAFKQASAGRHALHAASFQGHLIIIKYLVENHNCDPAIVDEAKVTPLACAMQEGKVDTVKYFLSKPNVNPNAQDKSGKTPFHYASMKGRLAIIKAVIEIERNDEVLVSVDINVLDNNGETPIIAAAKGKHLETVDYLIRVEACQILNDASQSGRSVLHYASAHGWLEIVTYLVKERHISPEHLDSTGLSSIHHAADAGALDVLRFLIEDCKCETNFMSKEGEVGHTPLLKACSRGRIEVVKYLIGERKCSIIPSQGKGMHPIHLASSGGHVEVATYLLEEGNQKIDLKDKQGAVPVHFSVLNGHLEMTKILIEQYNADPMATTYKEATAVHAACQGGHLVVLKYLIEERECHLKVGFNSGGSPLHRAVEHGHIDLVKYLIEQGVSSPLLRDTGGRVPLHFAALKGLVEMARYLLEVSLEAVLVQDVAGNAPLHLACSSGHESVIELLLLFNGSAQVKLNDVKGQSPLQLAKKSNKITNSLLMLFLEHGAPPTDLMEASPPSCGYLSLYKPLYSYIKVFLVGEYKEVIDEFVSLEGVMTRPTANHHSFPVISTLQTKIVNDCMFYEIPTVTSCNSPLILDALTISQHPVLIISIDSYKESDKVAQEALFWLRTLSRNLRLSESNSATAKCTPLLIYELDDHEQPSLRDIQDKLSGLGIPQCSTLLNTDPRFAYSRRTSGKPFGAGRILGIMSDYSNILPISQSLPVLVCALRSFLTSSFMNNDLFCTLEELINKIQKNDVLLPTDPDKLANMLTTLCQGGYIFFIKNQSNLLSSMIVLDTVIVPELIQRDLQEMKPLPLGVISETHLLSHCTTDSTLFLSIIKYYGACIEVTQILNHNGSIASNTVAEEDPLYYFPLVLPPNPPSGLMLVTKSNQITFGWIMQCEDLTYFPTNFISLLPVGLPLSVDPDLLEKSVNLNGSVAVWKDGVHWVKDGMKMAAINISGDAVLVVVKGRKSKLLEVSWKRNKLVKSLRNLIKVMSEEDKEVKVEEYIIHPESLRNIEFDKDLPSITAVPLMDVECDYKQAETALQSSYKEFLGFEPYHLIKHSVIGEEFFSEDKQHYPVTSEAITKLSKQFKPFLKEIRKLFGHEGLSPDATVREILKDWAKNTKATYTTLWNQMKDYSLYG